LTAYLYIDIIIPYTNPNKTGAITMISELKEALQRIEKKLKALRGYL